ncbi:MAG: hypothetical protein CMH57_07710 [Myxococcales bacterium]|nr:hypothetical protein [Myxococcales bacterium]
MGEDTTKLSKAERKKLDRMEVALDRIDALLLKLGQQGLQRMSRSSLTELQASAQTAHNAALIAIERQLEVLATLSERYMERDPLFQMSQYMATLNKLWLLVGATRRRHEAGETPDELLDLIGAARRKYEVLDDPIVVQALGASGWVTDTDFVGVTIYMGVRGQPGVIYQASNAKPTRYFGTDPRGLLNQSVSDYLPYTIRDFAHGAFTFSNAKVSHDGRMSLHKALRVSEAPYTGSAAYKEFAVGRWTELVERLRENELNPLSGSGSTLAYLEPSGFGELEIDMKSSLASSPLLDDKGATLMMEVSLREENNHLIDNLEAMLDNRRSFPLPAALFGRVSVRQGQLKLYPMTAIYDESVTLYRGPKVHEVHLSLEKIKYSKSGVHRRSR